MRMSAAEFRKLGYLQELNRQFLHPLGLALYIVIEEDGSERFGEVWDSRDDPEGFVYGDPFTEEDKQRARRIAEEAAEKASVRQERLGWVVQPI